MQSPLVVTLGLFVLAGVLIALWRTGGRDRGFFARPLETL